jgi:hypothetical protein
MTSSFSYKWIPYNPAVKRKGARIDFQYKITGNNNTLSLSVQTILGEKTLLWSIHGNHGSRWKNGVITYWPTGKFEVGLLVVVASLFVCLFISWTVCLFVCLFVCSFL